MAEQVPNMGLGDLVGGHETCHILVDLIVLNHVGNDKIDSQEVSFYSTTVILLLPAYFRLSLSGNFAFTLIFFFYWTIVSCNVYLVWPVFSHQTGVLFPSKQC